ncbi:heterokaryon incompatibility protein-domain-containing protein [Daldinia grandis]|nr:heterokaryon incompatibility protein-domain-containing protein [Daldinia grandis]
MSEEHHQENREVTGADALYDFDPCPVCRNFDPKLAPQVHKYDETIFSLEPFGFTLGVKVQDPTSIWPHIQGELQDIQVEEKPNDNAPLYEIDRSLLDVSKQASQGCRACDVLLRAFIFSWTRSENTDPKQRSGKEYDEVVPSLYLHALFSPGRNVLVNITTRNKGSRSVDRLDVLQYQLFALPNKPNPWSIVGRLADSPGNVLNDGFRGMVQSWIQKCADEHPHCGGLTPAKMPRRLVNVGVGDGDVYLEEDIPRLAPYIALSHCWKFSEPLKMTRSRLKRIGTSISLEELSPTLRDAVRVARWLAVQYLWIDSLCIIQDDAKDWQEQSVQMGNIYRQSYFTIAAHVDVKAPSATHGCFLERKHFYELSHQDGLGQECSTLVRGDFTHTEDPITPLTLTGRGWCYQERLLASRIVHFRPCEISFECFDGTRCECEALLPQGSLPWPRRPYESVKHGFGEYASIAEPAGHSSPDRDAWMAWYAIVSNYATTDFTFKTDRLPALASTASRMPQRVFGSYRAGLWTKELICELLWRRSYNKKRFRDKPYVAPNFSWASGTGPIQLWNPWKEFGEPCHLAMATIHEVHCELETLETFGQVRDGTIRLSGRVSPVRLQIPFLQRISWALKAIPWMQRVEWLPRASEMCKQFCYKLRRFARKLDEYPALHFGRAYIRKLAEKFNHNGGDTTVDVTLLPRMDKPPGDLDRWSGTATSDTEEDSSRIVWESLVAVELATWISGFSTIDDNEDGYIRVGCLLLAPSRRMNGAYDRVGHIEFRKGIKKHELAQSDDGREGDLRRLNDCFAACEQKELVVA